MMNDEAKWEVKAVTKQEFIDMGKRASDEIKSLRRRIEHLTPKADAYDNLVMVLNLLPKPSRGYEEDLAWKLDRRIEELSAKPDAAPTT